MIVKAKALDFKLERVSYKILNRSEHPWYITVALKQFYGNSNRITCSVNLI